MAAPRVHSLTPGKRVVIVDDLVQSGGTLYECAVALKAAGAAGVSAFVAHGVFPNSCWENFLDGGSKAVFEKFWVTNSIPTTTDNIPEGGCFEVIDLLPQFLLDLDHK